MAKTKTAPRATADSVASITTTVKRRSIVIDGVKLALLNQNELKLDAGVRLRLVLEAFRGQERHTEDGARSLSQRLSEAVRDVLPGLPQEIEDKLSDENKIDIIVAFLAATASPAPGTAHPLPVQS